MNVIKDVVFEGRILQVTEKALEFVRGQIKERTYLGADTRFVTEPEYPEFAWKELIVNASRTGITASRVRTFKSRCSMTG